MWQRCKMPRVQGSHGRPSGLANTKGQSGIEGHLMEIPNRGKRLIISGFTSGYSIHYSVCLSPFQSGPVGVQFGTGWHYAALTCNLPSIIHRLST